MDKFGKFSESAEHLQKIEDFQGFKLLWKKALLNMWVVISFRFLRLLISLGDYWKQGNAFISHYVKRGYSKSWLKKIASEIVKVSSDNHTFTFNLSKANTVDDRIHFVINWHHYFARISKISYESNEHVAKEISSLETDFSSVDHCRLSIEQNHKRITCLLFGFLESKYLSITKMYFEKQRQKREVLLF